MRWRPRVPSSLSARLTLLVVALAIPMLLVIALTYADILSDRRRAETASATQAARNGAAIVEGFVRDLESTTFATAGLLADTPRPFDQPTLGSYLAAVLKQYPEVRAYFIADTSGKVVASASGEGIGLDLSSRPYMVTLRGGAKEVWSGSISGLQSGEITVAFGRPITRNDGTLRGYIVTAFYPERVIAALRPAYPSDARLVIIDEKGKLIYDSGRTEPSPSEIDVSADPSVKAALAGETVPIDGVASPVDTSPQFGAIVPVARTGWALSMTRPLSGLEAELAGRLFGDAAVVLLMLGVAAAIALLIANRLAGPLRELAGVSAAIARGERPVIPEARGGLEVSQLSTAMRTMQTAVAKREDELRLLARAGESLSGTLNYDESLRRAARVAIPDFADWSVVDVLENGLITRAATAIDDPALEALARELRERFPPSQPTNPKGPIPQAIATRRPLLRSVIDDEYLDRVARHPEERELFRQLRPRSFLALPLVVGDRVIGAVTFITSTSGRHYTEGDIELGQQLARRIALSVENARLYYEVQQSVRTRDDFLSAVAHELKTPLTVISASAQMMRRRGGADGDGIEPTLIRIQSSVTRMTSFIEELLELLRHQNDESTQLHRAPADLVDIARRAIADAAPLAQGQEIVLDSSEPVIGEWDGTRIERAFGNLIGNAIKYNRPGGTVRVRVRRGESGGQPVAVIAVTDQGIGIPAADRSRIFERFTRGSNVAGRIAGSGVGLAIVRQIIEQHGGSVEVESVEGKGSTFTVTLPFARAMVSA